jgi:D-glycero-D-manno-heptose 1,7-bisphosphate phosphatase
MDKEKRPAVFLDRDGTINEEMGYINHPDRFILIPGTAGAIKRLNDAEVLTVVVTNQSGVAQGYFTEDLLLQVLDKMKRLLEEEGASLDGLYYCPHHPTTGPPEYKKACQCRKPQPGMIEQAAAELPIDLARSYCVGDRIKDIYFAHKLGLKSVLVLTGYGHGEYEYQRDQWTEQPEHIAANLAEAVTWILEDLKGK